MFKCEVTGKTTKPGEKMHKVVVETKEKVYFEPRGENGKLVEVGRGTEIVKEICVSEAGLRVLREKAA